MTPWIELNLTLRSHRLLSLGNFTVMEIAQMLNCSVNVIRRRMEVLHKRHIARIVGSQRVGRGRAAWVWGLQ